MNILIISAEADQSIAALLEQALTEQHHVVEKKVSLPEPHDITVCEDDDVEIASFSYYDGLEYARGNCLLHTTSMSDVRKGTHFLVCCGQVMVKVETHEFTHIARRVL